MPTRRTRGPLATAHLALLGAMTLHAADHFRQGVADLAPEVLWGGVVLFVLAAATLPFTMREHPLGPLVAAVVGFWVALAVLSSHVAPEWSAFSNPYPQIGADVVSWIAMLLEVIAAVVLGVLGVRMMRRHPARP